MTNISYLIKLLIFFKIDECLCYHSCCVIKKCKIIMKSFEKIENQVSRSLCDFHITPGNCATVKEQKCYKNFHGLGKWLLENE